MGAFWKKKTNKNFAVTQYYFVLFPVCIADYWELWSQLRAKSDTDGSMGNSGRSVDHVQRPALNQTRNERNPTQQERHCYQSRSTRNTRKTFEPCNLIANIDKTWMNDWISLWDIVGRTMGWKYGWNLFFLKSTSICQLRLRLLIDALMAFLETSPSCSSKSDYILHRDTMFKNSSMAKI